jgi:FkbM family methyltransferase
MTLSISEGVLNRRVFNQGVYNMHRKHYMLGQTEKYIDPNMAVIDIGAAVGMYSFFWAGLCKCVYAFEAVPPVFDRLCETAARKPNIIPFQLAVSDYEGQTEFWVDDKRLSNSSFSNLVGGQQISVNVTTIDSHGFGPISFMKVDVEGHELAVLRGAGYTIERYHPTIMCEIYPKFNDGPVIETFKHLFERGYKCFYNIRGEGLHPVSSPEHGTDVASDETLIPLHDGDFLFVYGN